MKHVIKTIALLTTGLAVGVAVERKRISCVKDIDVFEEIQDQLNGIEKIKISDDFIDSVDNLIIDLSENVKTPSIEQSAKVRALAQLLNARAKF